jgi:hypothetical protein
MVITTMSNQQLLPNLPGKIQMANTLKLRITQASDQVINDFCICLILGRKTDYPQGPGGPSAPDPTVRYRSSDRPQIDCKKNLKQNRIENEGEPEHDEHAKNTVPADCPPGTRGLSAPHGQKQKQLDPAGQLLQHITGSPKR